MAVAISPSDRSSIPGESQSVAPASAAGNLLGALLKDRIYTGCSHLSFREKYLDKALDECKSMYSCDIRGHHGCVNALAFSKGQEQFLASGGDDQRVLVWRVADMVSKPKRPRSMCMNNRHTSNIFTLDFSCDNSYIFSGGEDKELLMHDFKTGYTVNTYEHLNAVYCATSHPTSPDVVYTASEDGCVYIIDTRVARRQLGEDMLLCQSSHSFQCVAVNPVEPVLIAVSNTRSGSSLYDLRMKKMVLPYECSRFAVHRHDGVSVAFDSTGSRVYSMYRQRPPTLHNLYDPDPICYFSDCTGHYRNTITMKSGCFMGRNDEYVVSGSDDFRVYIWKVPSSEQLQAARQTLNKEDVCAILCTHSPRKGSFEQSSPHLVFPGHRSIVNQARYSPVNRILVTSGVEKIVKVWSDLPIHSGHTLHQSGGPPARQRFTPSELRSILMGVSYSEPSDPTEEDVKVLALFDNLVDEIGELSDSSDDSLFAPSDGDFFFPYWRSRGDHWFSSSDSSSDSLFDDWDSFSDDSSEGEDEIEDHGGRGHEGVMAERNDDEEQVDSLEEEVDSLEEDDTLDDDLTEDDYDEDMMDRVGMFTRGFIRCMNRFDEPTAHISYGTVNMEDGPSSSSSNDCGDVLHRLSGLPVNVCVGGDAEGGSRADSEEKRGSKRSTSVQAEAAVKNESGSASYLPASPVGGCVRKGAKAQVKKSAGFKSSTSSQKGKSGSSSVTNKAVSKNSKSKSKVGSSSNVQNEGGIDKPSGAKKVPSLETEQVSGMRLRTREISRTTQRGSQRKMSSKTESASTSNISDGACALDRPPGLSSSDPHRTTLPGTSEEVGGAVGAIALPFDSDDGSDANNGRYRTRSSKRKKLMDFRARCDSGALQESYTANDFLRTKSPTSFYGSSETSKRKESGKGGAKKGGRKKGGGGGSGNR